MSQKRCNLCNFRFAPLRVAALCLALSLVCGLLALALPSAALAQNPPAKPKEIEKAISAAKSQAEAGQAGLSRLTDRERKLNSDLAAAEDRIAALEKDLTKREEDILRLVAQGLSNREVGQTLDLQEKTVKHYMTAILQKLHVRNRVEAAMLAREHLKG